MASMSPLASAVTESGGARLTNWIFEVHARVARHALDGHRHRRALGHADLELLEVLRRADDLLALLAEHDLLRAGDVALGGDVVDGAARGGDGHDHGGCGRPKVDVACAPHRREIGAR